VEKKSFHFPEARGRYLRVIVYNYDDPPLHLGNLEVQGIPKDVIFQAALGRQYFLYYGNESAAAPRYDLERIKNYLSTESLARVKLAGKSRNHAFIPASDRRPWTERRPALFWGVLIVLVLTLGAYIIRLMKRVRV